MLGPAPTLADLERAKTALELLEQQYADYSGNNPGKYDSRLKAARTEVRSIEAALKQSG